MLNVIKINFKLNRSGELTIPPTINGFTLIEVLVAIVLVAIVSLTTTYSTINAYALYNHSTRAAFARQLAFSAMEELAA